jgi:hypothetical protein
MSHLTILTHTCHPTHPIPSHAYHVLLNQKHIVLTSRLVSPRLPGPSGSAMSRAELPHTIASHPSLSLSLSLPADDISGEAVFLAGGELGGFLQLQCSGGIGLSRIEVELVGREGE